MSGWVQKNTQPWDDPLAFAHAFSGQDIALLYSGIREPFTGGFSYLLVDPIHEISGTDWAQLPPLPSQGEALPLWVGYLGYGMRDGANPGDPSPITLPNFRLVRYEHMFRFDHEAQRVERFEAPSSNTPTPSLAAAQRTSPPFADHYGVNNLASNLTRSAYESSVAATIEHIHDGAFYQANITRKFSGTFSETPDSFAIFATLCAASPAPYSAYIRHRGTAILSSSPECFLRIDANGTITTRPIKGSARRSADETEDQKIRDHLAASQKNHAENLMIVDLMRNDLSRISIPSSVRVIEQSALYSYRTIHHLISTITAQKMPAISVYEAVRACFPAGSMTGAPKIAAMRWCEQQEKIERGVYSGAIGWFGAGNSCDLSVVIRTLIIAQNRFEFQVGGGIVADSTPEDEWRETLTKARGILAALGLHEEDMMAF